MKRSIIAAVAVAIAGAAGASPHQFTPSELVALAEHDSHTEQTKAYAYIAGYRDHWLFELSVEVYGLADRPEHGTQGLGAAMRACGLHFHPMDILDAMAEHPDRKPDAGPLGGAMSDEEWDSMSDFWGYYPSDCEAFAAFDDARPKPEY